VKSLDAALLRALRQAQGYCSGGDLADAACASLGQVEARMLPLRMAGFQIEERPGLGYRLVACPDRLIADDLFARMQPSTLIRDILVFEETDSTNERGAALGKSGAGAGVAVFAERQTSGRGRFGRRWDSASHLGLWFSLLLRPVWPLALWPRITTCAAAAIAAALDRILPVGVPARIKWPNDIWVSGRKVAGILMETGVDRLQQPFAVLGIGLNANHSEDMFPVELAKNATSLFQVLGRKVDRSDLAVSIFEEFEARFSLIESGFDRVMGEVTQRSTLLGKWVQFQEAGHIIAGQAEALDDEGRLLLRRADGTVQRLNAGEVTVVTARV
jgi:BirA family biotin operon repressor/biotin-[acetyl-CoA-carboxylase] ligase